MATRHQRVLCGVLIVALLVLPFVLSTSLLNGAIKALIAALFALAFNLLMGQGGMLSFGHGAYLGLGAFATMHAMIWAEKVGYLPLPLLPLAGAVAGLLSGIIAGYFATKRTGTYFAMVTLAIAELLHSIAMRWTSVFGGEAGLSSMRMPFAGISFGSPTEVYFLVLAWVMPCTVLLYLYTRTPFGRLSLAIRDNELRVRFLGNDAHRAKTVMFAISAMFAGVAGGLLAITDESVSYSLFDARVSALIVLQSFIGGVGVFFGPAFGAAALTVFSQLVSDFSRSWLLYQGLLFIAVMLFLPQGLWGSVIQKLKGEQGTSSGVMNHLKSLSTGGAALFVTCAIIFVVELASILLSTQYGALRRGEGNLIPSVELFGFNWDPLSPITWTLPVMLVAGAALLHFGMQRKFDSHFISK